MAVRVDIGLDLGNDTLKIAYALKKSDGTVEYGKFAVSDLLSVVAVPAIAYYDTDAQKWLFADEVDRSGSTSFITVVKIKNLISMLQYNGDSQITSSNADYYRKKNRFPKFFFPVRKKVLSDFKEMVRLDRTFTAEGCTPQSVCEDFFRYVAKKVFSRIAELKKARGLTDDVETRLAVVYPPKVGEEYIAEFKRICALAFDKPINSALSSTKALGMFAYKRKAIRSGDNALVFDMGDEDISVARVGVVKSKGKAAGTFESLIRGGGNSDTITVDGADGHSDPLALGGQNVDERIEEFIEREISKCETMGTPSSGSEGHIAERGLHSKQYLFMKDIKKAKVILSRELSSKSLFKDGVPVTVARSLLIQRKVTRDMLKSCLGTATGGAGLAKEIADYIINEIKLPVNRGVNKIFLSGGLTETYSLLEYIKDRIRADGDIRKVEVMTYDDDRTLGDMPPAPDGNAEIYAPVLGDTFTVLSHEDSVYAPAVGGAIVSVLDLKVPTALALTYGTWGYKEGKKVFIPFVEKGSLLEENKPTAFMTAPFKTSGVRVDDEEIYSCALSYDDITNKTVSGIDYYETSESADPRSPQKAYLLVGEIKGNIDLVSTREKCQRIAGLRTVSGGAGSGILYLYRDRRVELLDPQKTTKVRFREGVIVTPDGRATPKIENASEPGATATVTYLNGYGKRINPDKRETVPAKDIVFEFEGVDGFAATEGK